ncbi:MAG: hypothetical protein ACYC3K_04185 [Candidatus Nanopelagicales bacterium]
MLERPAGLLMVIAAGMQVARFTAPYGMASSSSRVRQRHLFRWP